MASVKIDKASQVFNAGLTILKEWSSNPASATSPLAPMVAGLLPWVEENGARLLANPLADVGAEQFARVLSVVAAWVENDEDTRPATEILGAVGIDIADALEAAARPPAIDAASELAGDPAQHPAGAGLPAPGQP